MAGADGVFGEDQRAVVGVPDRDRPIPDKLGEGIGAPLFVGRRDDGKVGGIKSQNISQAADKLGAVVQAAIPGNDRARRGNLRLRFTSRFLRGVESTIENHYGALGIRFVAVGSVRSESCTNLLEVVRGWRLAFPIPSSKLHAHDSFPLCFRLGLSTCRALHTASKHRRLPQSAASKALLSNTRYKPCPLRHRFVRQLRETQLSSQRDIFGPRCTVPRNSHAPSTDQSESASSTL